MGCLRERWLVVSIGGVILSAAAGLAGIGALSAVAEEPGVVAEGADPVDRRLAATLEAHSAETGRLEARVRAAKGKLLAETVSRLQTLQDEYCRAARLDEALAVREAIRGLQREAAAGEVAASPPAIAVRPAPDSLARLSTEIGAAHFFKVTGSSRGIAWGTDLYTLDSNLSVAAVHAGTLADGETGVVKVTIVDSPAEHVGSHRHGITTHGWPRYRMSFRVERVGAVSAVTVPGVVLPSAAVEAEAHSPPGARPTAPAPPTLPAIPLTPAIPRAPAIPRVPARPLSPYDQAPPPPTAAEPIPSEAPAASEQAAPRRPFD